MNAYFTEHGQLLIAILGAVLVGLAKTGVAGLGVLVSAIFALVLPARFASGFVLPMLILGDFIAVRSYREHAQWKQVLRLFPWTIPGIVAGYITLGRIDDHSARVLIGAIILVIVAWHWLRKLRAGKNGNGKNDTAHPTWMIAVLGILAGFTTLVANAAGPIMTLYLLAVGLPKLEFVGTAAVFFFALNLFKVPFMVHLGLINGSSILWNLMLAPAVLLGTWLGKLLLKRVPQRLFEQLALALSALAALKLLF